MGTGRPHVQHVAQRKVEVPEAVSVKSRAGARRAERGPATEINEEGVAAGPREERPHPGRVPVAGPAVFSTILTSSTESTVAILAGGLDC